MLTQNGNNSNPVKVPLYFKVSTEDQAGRETIQNQINIARTLCPAMGLEIAECYFDDGGSCMIPWGSVPRTAGCPEGLKVGKVRHIHGSLRCPIYANRGLR